jgi:molybdopterin-guanine dinucleotide biosynthesis protein A
MDQPVAASAIVLAGGRSSRFGSDKLALRLGGEPLVHHAIRAVAQVATEVVVVAGSRGPDLALTDVPVRLHVVVEREGQGPLAALARGAEASNHRHLLLVGGDMPLLEPRLLRRLLAWPEGLAGAALELAGRAEPLPLGLDREVMSRPLLDLLENGQRSLRALIQRLRIECLAEAEWRTLDPGGRSTMDVDRPEDLARIQRAIDPAWRALDRA